MRKEGAEEEAERARRGEREARSEERRVGRCLGVIREGGRAWRVCVIKRGVEICIGSLEYATEYKDRCT